MESVKIFTGFVIVMASALLSSAAMAGSGVATNAAGSKGTACEGAKRMAHMQAGSEAHQAVMRAKIGNQKVSTSTRLGECQCELVARLHSCFVEWAVDEKQG